MSLIFALFPVRACIASRSPLLAPPCFCFSPLLALPVHNPDPLSHAVHARFFLLLACGLPRAPTRPAASSGYSLDATSGPIRPLLSPAMLCIEWYLQTCTLCMRRSHCLAHRDARYLVWYRLARCAGLWPLPLTDAADIVSPLLVTDHMHRIQWPGPSVRVSDAALETVTHGRLMAGTHFECLFLWPRPISSQVPRRQFRGSADGAARVHCSNSPSYPRCVSGAGTTPGQTWARCCSMKCRSTRCRKSSSSAICATPSFRSASHRRAD